MKKDMENTKEILVEEAKEVKAEKATKAKKTTKKKAVKKECYLELMGKQIDIHELEEKAAKAYAELCPETALETLQVYINIEEGVAYYVANGEPSDDYCVSL